MLFGSTDGITWVEIGPGTGDEHFDLEGIFSQVRYLRI